MVILYILIDRKKEFNFNLKGGKAWKSIKEDGKCPECGNEHGVIYEQLGRDPVLTMYCAKCKIGFGFGFDFSKMQVEIDHFDGNENFYGNTSRVPTYNMTFTEIASSAQKLGMG
jgi:hypothetical protein